MKTTFIYFLVAGLAVLTSPVKVSGQLYLKSDGRVSIGTDNPATSDKLTILQTTGSGIFSSLSGTPATSVYGYTSASSGINYALFGLHASTDGAAGFFHADNNNGGAPGVLGRADGNVLPASCGVAGYHFYGGIGVGAWSYAGDLFRGYSGDYPSGTLRFYITQAGAVYADGGFNTFKSLRAPGEKTEYRTFYSVQGTECWIEDIGSAVLQHGEAAVYIDPVFAQAVRVVEDYKVFLTPVSEDIVLLVVADKRADHFVVRGRNLDGRPVSCTFDYRIVAQDRESEGLRMEVLEIRDPVDVPRME